MCIGEICGSIKNNFSNKIMFNFFKKNKNKNKNKNK